MTGPGPRDWEEYELRQARRAFTDEDLGIEADGEDARPITAHDRTDGRLIFGKIRKRYRQAWLALYRAVWR